MHTQKCLLLSEMSKNVFSFSLEYGTLSSRAQRRAPCCKKHTYESCSLSLLRAQAAPALRAAALAKRKATGNTKAVAIKDNPIAYTHALNVADEAPATM